MDTDGNKVATFLAAPRSPLVDARRCVIEVANRWLYYDDLLAIVDMLLSMLPMAITGLSRIDLCCDFEMTPELWATYCRLADGSAYVRNLGMGTGWWKRLGSTMTLGSVDTSRVTHCLTFGGVESVLKWKIYYKFLELQEAEPEHKKPYISALWREMGFVEHAVWRIEVSINGTNKLAAIDGHRILPLDWYRERVRLFCDLYTDKFVVRADEKHKDKRNDTVLPFLCVDGSRSLCRALPKSSRDESDPERRAACKLWREYCQADTQANASLCSVLRTALCELLERPSNLHAIMRSFAVSAEDIVRALMV